MSFSIAQTKSGTHRGFTLIEMLVVLVIVGLMATLVVQGFGYSLGIYQRVVKTQRNAYSEVFVYNWLRSSLGAQVAVRPKDRGLEGNVVALTTYTYQPLIDHAGIKTLIGWQVVQEDADVRLEYREANQTVAVYRWPDANAKFEYMDDKGVWHDQWPLQKSDLPPLPESVRLIITQGQDSFNYVMGVHTRKHSEVTMDEVLYGR